jgi:hypothetical protein
MTWSDDDILRRVTPIVKPLDTRIIEAIIDPDITAGALEILLIEIRQAITSAVATVADAIRIATVTVTSPESIKAQALAEAGEIRVRKLEGILCVLSKKLEEIRCSAAV